MHDNRRTPRHVRELCRAAIVWLPEAYSPEVTAAGPSSTQESYLVKNCRECQASML